jgi:dolichyl-phosphate-mannose--protein O-mannosyl transferase
MGTGKNLHSHHYKRPLSSNKEVSAFGVSGEGDEGDDWIVDCSGVEATEEFQLKHA